MGIEPVKPGDLPQDITARQMYDKMEELEKAVIPSPKPTTKSTVDSITPPPPMIPSLRPLRIPTSRPLAAVQNSGPRGFFTCGVKSNMNAIQHRVITPFVHGLVVRAYLDGSPRQDCEILNKVVDIGVAAAPGVLTDFKSQVSQVKPFFDFDCTMPNQPEDDHVLDMVHSWQLQVYDIIKPHVPALELEWILPAVRHRSLANTSYKISARFFVKGVRTTVKHLEDVIRAAMEDGTVYSMDMSVYSSVRKMSMVFCVKDKAKADDAHVLVPGWLTREVKTIMEDPDFDPLDYVIQYVKDTDFLLVAPASSAVNKRDLPPAVLPVAKKGRMTSETTESTTFAQIAAVLSVVGFTNIRQDGEPVKNDSTTVFNFRCDNQDNCPLCNGQHSSNRWYVVLGKYFIVANHSDNCLPPDANADISVIRPCSPLMKVLAKVGPSRHHDYAFHFKEECKGRVMYDELDKSFYIFDGVQWKSISEQQVHMQLFNYLEQLMNEEVAHLQILSDLLKCVGVPESQAKIGEQLRTAKTSYCNIGKTDFQRSVLAQVKMLMCIPETIQWDGKPNLVHFADGCLDLHTGEFRATQLDDYNRNTVGFEYNMEGWQEARPLWEDCVKTILPKEDIRRLFRMFVGLCLSGYTNIKKIFCLCDMKEGHNGKSFIMKLVSLMLGDYSWTPNRNMIARSRGSNAEAPANFLMALRGKRLFVNEEMGEAQLDTALLKEWTSGVNDLRITARKNFGDPVTWVAFFKIALTANRGKLNFDTTDPAFRKRLLTIPFEVTFVSGPSSVKPPYYVAENKSHADFLMKHMPLRPAMVRWAIDGFKDMLEHSYLWDDEHLPRDMLKFKNEVVLYNDPAMNLIHDIIMFTDDENDQIMPIEVWRQYRQTNKCPRNAKEKDFYASLKLFVQQNRSDAWFVHSGVALVKYHKYRYSSVGMTFQ